MLSQYPISPFYFPFHKILHQDNPELRVEIQIEPLQSVTNYSLSTNYNICQMGGVFNRVLTATIDMK